MKRGILIAGLAIAAVAGGAAWLRRSAPAPVPVPDAAAAVATSPAPAPVQAVAAAPPAVQPAVRRKHVRKHRHRTFVRKRSWKKSAAIVGGSAATGAAIGALAGGGKGAGIGALAGGGAGLVYDRLTHKKRVRQ